MKYDQLLLLIYLLLFRQPSDATNLARSTRTWKSHACQQISGSVQLFSAALRESVDFSSLGSRRQAKVTIREGGADASSALTGLVCRVIVLHQKGVAVVPDLLAGVWVVVGDQRLQRRVEDALSHDYVDGGLTVASRHSNRLLPHGMNWRERRGEREGRKGKMSGSVSLGKREKELHLLSMLRSAAFCLFTQSISKAADQTFSVDLKPLMSHLQTHLFFLKPPASMKEEQASTLVSSSSSCHSHFFYFFLKRK